MKKLLFALPALLFLLVLGSWQTAWADGDQPGYYDASDPGAYLLAQEDLEDLVAPIALYPDPLIAQILPAATYIDQIDEAARYLRQYGKYARIDAQPWDLSVKAVAHYPDVLFMMDQKYDWTVALGQAFLDQQPDLLNAIQALRADALEQGNLFSTREQQVIDDADGIRIVPAVPEYVYVPVYDPQTVYVERYDPSYPVITFGVGLAIGAWLSRDCDWHEHKVYYHGWRGGGWIGRSKPVIRDRGNVYINSRAAVITTNRRILQHDTQTFRQQLKQDTQLRRQAHPQPAGLSRPNRPRPGGIEQHAPGGQQRPPEAQRQSGPGAPGRPAPSPAPQHQPVPAAVNRPAPGPAPQPAAGNLQPPATGRAGKHETQPGARDVSRGRDVQQTQPASRSGYGGYGSGSDAAAYRQRGETSQQNMRQTSRPGLVRPAAPAPALAPAPHPAAAPAPRPAAAPAQAQRPAMAPAAPAHQMQHSAPTQPNLGGAPASRPGRQDKQQH